MSIPAAFIEDVLERTDLAELVGRYVPLKKRGANFLGLCPFHNESTPSFTVSPTKQFFHCFGCGKGGDAIAFLREHSGMSFTEALESLAREQGLELPRRERDLINKDNQKERQEEDRREQLRALMQKAAQTYASNLQRMPSAIAYLEQKRGLSRSIIERYELGCAPSDWQFLARVFPDYSTSALLAEAGLVGEQNNENQRNERVGSERRRYDRFRQRIIFPIHDIKGRCIALGGRALVAGERIPKYLNSPETPLFHKSRQLYGLHQARAALRQKSYALVCEGYMDVLTLAQWGFENSVATLGTACTSEHVQQLYRHVDNIVFAFDGDEAGRSAAAKALEAVLPQMSDRRAAQFLFFPPQHDPDSFLREQGAKEFERLIESALPFDKFLLKLAAQGCDLVSAAGAARMASEAQRLWSLLPDEGLMRSLILNAVAHKLGLPPDQLLERWQGGHKRSRRGDYGVRASPVEADAIVSTSPAIQKKSRKTTTPATLLTIGADQAARILLSSMHWASHLSHEDWDALVEREAPHGQLFTWLEEQYQERGVLPWSQLRQSLESGSGEPFGIDPEWVTGLMHNPPPMTAMSDSEREAQYAELRSILQPWLTRRINAQLDNLAKAYEADPSNIELLRQYQALLERSRRSA